MSSHKFSISNQSTLFLKKPSSRIEVNMSEFKVCFLNTGDEVLFTKEVGPCICIMLQGEINSAKFILMHHWSGFDGVNDHKEQLWHMLNLTSGYYTKIIESYEQTVNKSTAPVQAKIINITVIGGQRKQYDDNNRLILSGTENEIKSIEKYLVEGLKDDFILYRNTTFNILPFLTEEQTTLSIEMKGFESIKYNISDEFESESDTITNSSHSI